VSKLQHQGDDHPDAASKHLLDAQALLRAQRYDGASYLSGYVVECAYKSVILHELAWDPARRAHDPHQLAKAHALVRNPKQYGHDLRKLAGFILTGVGARYMPDLPPAAEIFAWRETLRYAPPRMTKRAADEYGIWALEAWEDAIAEMTNDGVL
jgi:hypothetical protein